MNKFNLTALLVLAGAGMATQSAQAAMSYTQGDILIGFRATSGTGSTLNYVIDVGQSIFSAAPGATVDLGNFGADLSGSSLGFGSTWFTRNNVKWGVFGSTASGDIASTLYAGVQELPVGTQATGYPTDTSANQNTTLSAINQAAARYATAGTAANAANATFQNTSDSNHYSQFLSGGNWFGPFASSSFESTLNGTTKAIDLFRETPDNVTPGTLTGTYVGRFVIDSTGELTFTKAVPEPSTLTALAGGAALLGLVRRRRPVSAA
ncbi:MAG TPA: PEP-CTERM sorting domain-containing protein [Chthoniobacter sp.]|nr:PEP-CTERM sorting domain-containing protein [Chthoniobacter sp.]